MCFSALFSALFAALFLFGFYSLADSGERRKPHRTGHSGVRGGQDKECVFKTVMAEHGRIQNDEIKKN